MTKEVNAARGEVLLETTKGPMIMAVTIGALAKLEAETGKSITALEDTLDEGGGELQLINQMVYWLLRGGGNKIEPDDMVEIGFNIKTVGAKIKEAFTAWEDDAPKQEDQPT